MGRHRLFEGQSGTGVPRSTTLRVSSERPVFRQVLERARDSAALPRAPFYMRNTYIRITIFRADANAWKNFVSHPRQGRAGEYP